MKNFRLVKLVGNFSMIKKLVIFGLIITKVMATPTVLEVKYKVINVNGKSKKVATIEQPNGTWGYYTESGLIFDVIVKNELAEPTSIHWHGLILPNDQDGVAGITQQDPIAPGKEYHYKFPLKQSGTYWMHAHYGLQEQDYVEAPLIIETANDSNYQQVVVMFQDFSMKTPQQILQSLLPSGTKYTPHLMAMPIAQATSSAVMSNGTSAMTMNESSMHMSSGMQMNPKVKTNQPRMSADLNDVKYDAYLVNYHSPADPQITKVKSGAQVKLRFINGASASNFWVNLGKLNGTLVAVDGQDIKPITSNKFQIAMAQRLDIIVNIPQQGGTFPILGQVEGLKDQTGIILSTVDKPQPKYISSKAAQVAGALDYKQELQLHNLAQTPTVMDKPVILNLNLTGDMKRYTWQINGQMWPHITPFQVKQGQNVLMVIQNSSMMAHPMHLHGYDFKVINIDGQPINGALHDTILVLPYSKVTVEFVADYPGKWALHCHMTYHMATGMMTYLEVEPK